jgi:hypothetical protein
MSNEIRSGAGMGSSHESDAHGQAATMTPRDGGGGVQVGVDAGGAGTEAERPREDALARLAATIRSSLATDGLAQITTRLSPEDFDALAGLIGVVDERSDIRVDPARRKEQMALRSDELGRSRPSGYQAESLAMHTDRPTAAILAWYCLAQDERVGATILLDTSDLAEHLSPDELTALRGVQVSYALRQPGAPGEQVLQHPLLAGAGPRYEICYMPWTVSEPSSVDGGRALEKFADYVRQGQERRAIPIRLEPGESLFIDNRRMLHGRDALPEDSKRHMVRLYIRKPDGP